MKYRTVKCLRFLCLLYLILPLGGGCSSEPCCVPFGSKEYYERMFKELHISAERGDVQAKYGLGMMYCCVTWRHHEDGTLGPKNPEEGIKWFRRAAEQGHVEAQCELGRIYLSGVVCLSSGEVHVPADQEEARKWYRKAAEQGHPEGQRMLGVLHSVGDVGIPRDLTEAVKWYRKAAEQQDEPSEPGISIPLAQLTLGMHYLNGTGVPQDKAEAVRWFRKAAERGLDIAQCELGWCYLHGEGVPEDKEEAMKWFRKAAKQNYHETCFSLGKSIFLYDVDYPEDGTQAFTVIDGEHQKEEIKNHAIKMLRWAELMGYKEAAELLREIEKVRKTEP